MLYRSPSLKLYSTAGESEGAFRARLLHAAREKRDLAVEKLRKRYAPKLARLQDRIAAAQAKVETEKEQYKHQKLQTALSVGATVLGALFGRKAASVGTVGRATTAARGASRAARERGDVSRATEKLEDLREKLEELEAEFEEATEELEAKLDPDALDVEEHPVRPRKADIAVETLSLVWIPEWEPPQGERLE